LQKPKSTGAREELHAAVDAPGREQFLRADDAQFIAELGAENRFWPPSPRVTER
jgi:hypothetical protein